MKCPICNGYIVPSKTNHLIDADRCVSIIKNTPCRKCIECGEISYDNFVSMKLELIVQRVKDYPQDVAVWEYDRFRTD